MARLPRIDFPGAIHHAMSRGNGGEKIFFEADDYERFVALIGEAKIRFRFQLYAFCLMPNHFHLLLRTGDSSLSRVMQWLLTCYAVSSNLRRQRQGHLFQGRYKSAFCADDKYFLKLLSYIHCNPVRAGLVKRPGDWLWSGHRGLMKLQTAGVLDIEFPLSLFQENPAHAALLYEKFLEGQEENECALESIACATDALSGNLRPESGKENALSESGVSGVQRVNVLEQVASETGVDSAALLSNSRMHSVARARRLLICRLGGLGMRPVEIRSHLKCSAALVSKALHDYAQIKS